MEKIRDGSINMITFSGIIYVLSISMQLAGAELLIIRYWCKPIKKLNEEEINKEPHICEESLQITLRSEEEIFENIWLNRIAFLMIALGYGIVLFGNAQHCNKIFMEVLIIVISTIITTIAKIVAKKRIRNR